MQKHLSTIKSFIIVLALTIGVSYIFAWTGPTATPPSVNAPAPINVSNSAQSKDGGLLLGADGWSVSDFCIVDRITKAKTKCLSGAGGESATGRVISGTVAPNGSIINGSGFTVTKTGTGQYTVNFTTPFSGTPDVVVSLLDKTPNNNHLATVFQPTANGFSIKAQYLDVGPRDNGFLFIATKTGGITGGTGGSTNVVAAGVCINGRQDQFNGEAILYGGATCSHNPIGVNNSINAIATVICPTGTTKIVVSTQKNYTIGGEGAICVSNAGGTATGGTSGVSSIIAGSGISVSGATGNVTVSATGASCWWGSFSSTSTGSCRFSKTNKGTVYGSITTKANGSIMCYAQMGSSDMGDAGVAEYYNCQ